MRAARPLRRPLPLGLRPDVRQHRRRAAQEQGRGRSWPSWPSARRPTAADSSRRFPREFIDRAEGAPPVWAPFYTLHKIMAGLLDMYELLRQPAGPGRRSRAWPAGSRALGRPAQRRARWSACSTIEYGGMNEVLYNLYAVTGDRRPRRSRAPLRPRRRLRSPGRGTRRARRGCTSTPNIPKIIGAARRYELTGDERYRRIAEFFWQQVVCHRSYCTGGTSNGERWRTEPGILAGELGADHPGVLLHLQHAQAHPAPLRLDRRAALRRLLRAGPLQRHPRHAESRRRDDDVLRAARVRLLEDCSALPIDSFWCCTGTGVENFAKLGDSIYFHDDRRPLRQPVHRPPG